jgi:hypothetical protein
MWKGIFVVEMRTGGVSAEVIAIIGKNFGYM